MLHRLAALAVTCATFLASAYELAARPAPGSHVWIIRCASARGQDAELAAVRVGQHDPGHLALAHVGWHGTAVAQSAGFGQVVATQRGADVEVHPVLDGFGVR